MEFEDSKKGASVEIATQVFDEMPHCYSKVFSNTQIMIPTIASELSTGESETLISKIAMVRIKHIVIESLRERSAIQILSGIRLVHKQVFLQLPFHPGESITSPIQLIFLKIRSDISYGFPFALYSGVFSSKDNFECARVGDGALSIASILINLEYLPCSALSAIPAMKFGKNWIARIAGQVFNNMSQRGLLQGALLDSPSVAKLLSHVIISGLGTISELFDRSSQISENNSLDSFLGEESLLSFGDQLCLMLTAATTFTHPDHFIEDALKHCLHKDPYLRENFEAILGVARDIFMPLSFQGYLMPTVTTSLNRIDNILDVILKLCCEENCHWVDTGQEQNLRLLSLSIDLASDKKLIDSRNLARFFLSNALDAVEQNWISELLRLLSFDMDVNTPIKLCLLQMLSFPLSGVALTMFPVIAMAIGIQVPQKQWLELIGSRSETINQVPAHIAQATLETLSYISTSVPLIVVTRNPVIKMLTAVIQGCDSLHSALIIFVYEDSLIICLLLNHDLIHFLPFLGETCWSVPELGWDDKVQLRSYCLADIALYLNFLFLPFDPGIRGGSRISRYRVPH